MVEPHQVADRTYLIDARTYSMDGFTSVFLVAGRELALIDGGPSTSSGPILKGIRRLGFEPRDISYLVLTHLHLDHAGGAGVLLREMPKAQVVVAESGAKHIIDPSRLVGSIGTALGQRMMNRFGEVVPVAPGRVQKVVDGDVLDLGDGLRLRIILTPGHSRHELCVYQEEGRGLFAGDAVGIYLPEEDVLLPPTPPGFDLALAASSLRRLAALSVEMLFFGHFGVCGKAGETLKRGLEKLESLGAVALAALQEGAEADIPARLRANLAEELKRIRGKETLHAYVSGELIPLWSAGYISYYGKLRDAS